MYQRMPATVDGEIVEATTSWLVVLLMIGAHGRRSLDHLLPGSIAEGVAHHVSITVLRFRGM